MSAQMAISFWMLMACGLESSVKSVQRTEPHIIIAELETMETRVPDALEKHNAGI